MCAKVDIKSPIYALVLILILLSKDDSVVKSSRTIFWERRDKTWGSLLSLIGV